MGKNKLALVRTLTDEEMDIIEDALENWLDDYREDTDEYGDIIEKARKLYEEITGDD